jgi:hypothetical protein
MNVTQQLKKASDLEFDAALSVRKCFQGVLQTCLNAHGLGNDAALVGSTIKRKKFFRFTEFSRVPCCTLATSHLLKCEPYEASDPVP